jgi:hypothetical protein
MKQFFAYTLMYWTGILAGIAFATNSNTWSVVLFVLVVQATVFGLTVGRKKNSE